MNSDFATLSEYLRRASSCEIVSMDVSARSNAQPIYSSYSSLPIYTNWSPTTCITVTFMVSEFKRMSSHPEYGSWMSRIFPTVFPDINALVREIRTEPCPSLDSHYVTVQFIVKDIGELSTILEHAMLAAYNADFTRQLEQTLK
jgi:hypothetical protein